MKRKLNMIENIIDSGKYSKGNKSGKTTYIKKSKNACIAIGKIDTKYLKLFENRKYESSVETRQFLYCTTKEEKESL